MKKKSLAAIQRPEVEKSFYKLAKEHKARYIITAQMHEETLVLNFFCVTGKNYADISPEFRCFCQESDYISQDLESEKVKWKTASIMYQCNAWSGYPSYWWNGGGCVFAKGEALTKRTLASFLGEKNTFDTGFKAIEKYQDTIREQRLAKKHKKETDVIDFHMDKFGDIPDDYQQWTEKVLFEEDNYIFYNKKKKEAHCTKCGWDFEIDKNGYLHNKIGIWNHENKPHHNKVLRCPYCNSYLEAKSENMSRGQLVAVKWSVLVQNYGEEVLVRYFCHVKDFSNKDYRKPNYYRSEQFRSVHSKEKSIDFEWNKFKKTGKVRWMYQRENYFSYWSPSEYVLPRTIMLYNTQLHKDLQGTCMKYSCAKEFLDWLAERNKDPKYHASAWIVDRYFNSYRKYPWIEQLIKCGFIALADEMITNRTIDKSNIKMGRTICDTLGISKNMFHILRHQREAGYRDIEIMKYYREKYGMDILERDFDRLKYVKDDGWSDMYKKFIDFMEYTTLHKLERYLSEQKIKYPVDYFDYAKWLEEMGYDMRNEFNLYPKDFKKAHDDKSKEYQKFQDKKHKEEIKQFNRLLKKMREEVTDDNPVNIKIRGLFIRLPRNLDELKKEGENLHHCVGTYKEKVARGETLIYFIRKESEPDKSFFTLEWKGSVVQCRGSHNCSMTPEVKAFVEIFEKKMIEFSKAPVKKRKAG